MDGLGWNERCRAVLTSRPLLTTALVLAAWMAFATPALAAITFVGSNTTSGNVSVVTVNKPAGLTTADVMFALITQRGTNFPLDQNMVSVPAGWTLVLANDNGSSVGIVIYRKLATSSEPASYSWTIGSSNRTAAGIVAFRGVNTSAPVNVSGSQVNSASTSYTAPSVSTTVANAMLVTFYAATDGSGSVNAPTGMAQAFAVGSGGGSNGVVAGSSYAAQATIGASGNKISASNSSLVNIGALVALQPIAAAGAVDHYELSLPTASLACVASTATVTACANSSSPCTSAATSLNGQTATLSTSGATLGATTLTFNASGVASTTLSYPSAGNGTAVSVALSGEQSAATNARQCCPNGSSCSAANSCSTIFNTAGFIISSSLGGTSATVPTQIAGTGSGNYFLRAVQTSTSTQACVAALSGSTTVNWASQCNNPSTCSAGNRLSLTGNSASAIASNPNTGVTSTTPVAMTFDANGNAPFSFVYNDVGQITLYASKSASGSLLSALSGATNAFIVKPASFKVSGIKCTSFTSGTCAISVIASPGNNPGASTFTGPAFIQAGQAFSATVTAVDSSGNATPNYGQETAPEGVRLTASVLLPIGGSSGTLGNASAFGSFSGGVATGATFNWSEVGIINLIPAVADGDYLGAGNVTGTISGNVGRFIPDHFDTLVTQGCSAGGFTYSAQPLTVQITARNGQSTPAITVNYGAGTFAKAVTLSEANGVAGGSLSNTGVAPTAFSAGVAATNAPAFSYVSATTAPAVIKLRATDTDGVSSLMTVAASSVEGTSVVRSGRLQLQNAYGSERLALQMPLAVQYWSGGWQKNTADTCTSVTAGQFAWAFPAGTATRPNNLAACESAMTVSGAAPNYTLNLSAPGATNSGWADVTLNLGATAAGNACTTVNGATGYSGSATTANAPWLQFNWTGSAGNPAARATFGVFKSPIIYGRENY